MTPKPYVTGLMSKCLKVLPILSFNDTIATTTIVITGLLGSRVVYAQAGLCMQAESVHLI